MATGHPLWLHAPTGQWAKKHRGKVFYFGKDRAAAHQRYLAEWRGIIQGNRPAQVRSGVATVGYAVNHYLHRRRADLENGKLGASQWNHYLQETELVIKVLGRDTLVADLGPADFARIGEAIAHYAAETRKGKIGSGLTLC